MPGKGRDTPPRREDDARIALEVELESLRRDRAMLRSVFESAPVLIHRVDLDGTIRFMNRVVRGFELEKVIGTNLTDYLDEPSAEVLRAACARVARTGEPGAFETPGPGDDGLPRFYHTRVGPIFEGRRVVGLTLVSTDVTELKEAQRALSESEERLRVSLAGTGMGLWSLDPEAGEVEIDDTVRSILGVGPGEGPRTLEESLAFVHPDDREEGRRAIFAALEGQSVSMLEMRVVRPDGQERWALVKSTPLRDASGAPRRLIGGLLDVTSRHLLEESLRVAQRLQAVGQLAAGVAHDFNNLLTIVGPTLELAARQAPPVLARTLGDAREAVRQGTQLVARLMSLAGGREPSSPWIPALEDVGAAARRAVELCAPAFPPGTAPILRLEPGLPQVEVFPGGVEQILTNLLLNARDALEGAPDARPREVEVSAERIPEGTGPLTGRAGARPVDHVRVSVRDTGAGMSEETRRRVFEPFFTTKRPGHGTGLGLATAYAIAHEAGGWLECSSTPGEGSTFDLVLPAARTGPSE